MVVARAVSSQYNLQKYLIVFVHIVSKNVYMTVHIVGRTDPLLVKRLTNACSKIATPENLGMQIPHALTLAYTMCLPCVERVAGQYTRLVIVQHIADRRTSSSFRRNHITERRNAAANNAITAAAGRPPTTSTCHFATACDKYRSVRRQAATGDCHRGRPQ